MSWDITGNAGTNPSTNFLGTTDGQPLVIKTNASESMRIGTNGNVGIGTTTPYFRLTNSNQGNVTDQQPCGLAGGNSFVWEHPSSDTTSGYIAALLNSISGFNANGLLVKTTETSSLSRILTLDSGGTDRLVVLGNGNVGIGTSSPFARLEVVGTTPSTSTTYDSLIGFAGTDGGIGSLYHKSNGATSILGIESFNVGNTIKTPIVLQEYGGNVGIGTNAPGSKLTVQGDVSVSGDVILTGADCAEEFDIAEIAEAEPGMVVVFDQDGTLHQCRQAYDKRVAGVISGAGDYQPGLILDRRPSQENRMPVALVGKVYCKVDAQYGPIEVGDLLTTSLTPGHAMKAEDAQKAFGAVLGKALRSLLQGQGLIPVLIALQ